MIWYLICFLTILHRARSPRPGCSHWQEDEIEYSIANPLALEKDSGVVHARSEGLLENISQSEYVIHVTFDLMSSEKYVHNEQSTGSL